ncbi:hypothetical protein PLUA15_70115 [Pseudomonas lundensis]|uniref:Uncharacterized protein n=1 Tax=Pseudomonas lundensis TaxID=86185 RepID=A0AAX2HFE2_9PSED|nr:hypothetical protein PLUA15_70115 [Pseudomonas lundensis]
MAQMGNLGAFSVGVTECYGNEFIESLALKRPCFFLRTFAARGKRHFVTFWLTYCVKDSKRLCWLLFTNVNAGARNGFN